jgi:23S rRNA pseudouridine2605 synthase
MWDTHRRESAQEDPMQLSAPSGKERLHKAMARAGVASRRAAEQMIKEGRVRLNGKPVTELGTLVDVDTDRVTLDAKPVRLVNDDEMEKVYFLLNKPPKVLTTTKDDRGRRTVLDLIDGLDEATRIYPVGRLDFDAEGVLLLTNDGELANELTHPKFHVPRTYLAKVKGKPTEETLQKLVRGIYLEDGPAKAIHCAIVEPTKTNTWVEITVGEGRNRLVKRMFWRIQHPVARLIRVKFGPLNLDDLPPGRSRLLTNREVKELKASVR